MATNSVHPRLHTTRRYPFLVLLLFECIAWAPVEFSVALPLLAHCMLLYQIWRTIRLTRSDQDTKEARLSRDWPPDTAVMEAAARHAHMLTGTEVKVFPVDDRVCGNGILYYAPGRPYLMCVNTGFVARHPEALDGLVTHEYGHAVDRSSERKMVTMMLHNAVNSAGLLLGAYCVTTFVEGFLAGSPPLHCLLLMPSVLLAFWWIRFVKPSLNVLMNHASEYAADAHACRVAGLSAAVAALTAFETEPGKRSRHASDTHPSDGDRIAALKKYAERLALATRSS